MAVQWNFGEAFLNQMTERRRLDQQRDQYIQDMAYKNRQQSFNQMYQEYQMKNLDVDNLRQEAMLEETKRHNLAVEQKPSGGLNGFTLSPGQTRYDVEGNPLATIPPKPDIDKLSRSEILDEKKRKQKEITDQTKYDAVMKSKRLSKEKMIQLGLTDENYPYGGAYIYQGGAGRNPEIFITDEDLENFAEEKYPDAPNKWKIKSGNDPLGIR